MNQGILTSWIDRGVNRQREDGCGSGGVSATVQRTADRTSGLLFVQAAGMIRAQGWAADEVTAAMLMDAYREALDDSTEVTVTLLDGTIAYVNDRFLEVTGFTREQLIGNKHNIMSSGVQGKDVYEVLWKTISSGKWWRQSVCNHDAKGNKVWFDSTVGPLRDDEGNIFAYIAVRKNITRQKLETERLSALYQGQQVWVCELALDRGIISVNPHMAEMLGYREEDIKWLSARDITHPDDQESTEAQLMQMLEWGVDTVRFEKRFFRKDRSIMWADVSVRVVRDDSGAAQYFITVLVDITTQKQAAEENRRLIKELQHMATHDILTGLPNRALILPEVELGIAEVLRYGGSIGLLGIDLDGFKQINDTYGHEMGDKLLKAVAGRLRWCIRISDIPGRTGGDEFVVLLKKLNSEQEAIMIATKIAEALSQSFDISGISLEIGASIGVAMYPQDVTSKPPKEWDNRSQEERLWVYADMAMYKAKVSGKGRVCRFHPSMEENPDQK